MYTTNRIMCFPHWQGVIGKRVQLFYESFHGEYGKNNIVKSLTFGGRVIFSEMSRRTVENFNGFVAVRFHYIILYILTIIIILTCVQTFFCTIYAILWNTRNFQFQVRPPVKKSVVTSRTAVVPPPPPPGRLKPTRITASDKKIVPVPVAPSTIKKSQYCQWNTFRNCDWHHCPCHITVFWMFHLSNQRLSNNIRMKRNIFPTSFQNMDILYSS